MKSNTERERNILKQQIEAIENGYRLCLEIPWLWEVDSLTIEMKEKMAKRIFQTQEIRKFVREAKRSFVYGGLYVDGYINQLKAWKVEFIQQQPCNDYNHNHNHTLNCGPCIECLGTGKTLLLIAEKYVCIACKGSGIRSQEFETSDFIESRRDDLDLHASEVFELLDDDEFEDEDNDELALDVYRALGAYHEEFEYDSDWDEEMIREQYMLFMNR